MVQRFECGHSFQNNSALLNSILFMIVTLAIVSTLFFPSFFLFPEATFSSAKGLLLVYSWIALSWLTQGALLMADGL